MSGDKHVYVVHCLDDQTCGRANGEPRGGSTKRMNNYPAHKAYQVATSKPENDEFINKITAGPMVEEDDKYMIGSCFLLEATLEEVRRFVDNDPFKKENVWASTKIERFIPILGVKALSAGGNL